MDDQKNSVVSLFVLFCFVLSVCSRDSCLDYRAPTGSCNAYISALPCFLTGLSQIGSNCPEWDDVDVDMCLNVGFRPVIRCRIHCNPELSDSWKRSPNTVNVNL
ncbi:hypothetical protein B0T09DRAFT_139658 [Sordaria sp. MPI-SDFR-AT-0083]|nr:hypothetical protein B0T09DRAFT_139658 [Sordaria sp. MPI-SDFR-AT-0083]